MDTVEIIKAVVFGVVQGVTEWLPISSTGHMILLDEFLQFDMTPEFMEMFYVVIQLGAILAVLLLFWSKLCPVSFHGKPHLKKDVLALWPKIIVACIPAGVIGILWSDMLNALFFHPLVVITMLALFGVLFLVVEHQNKERTPTIESVEKLTYQAALWIGMFQLIAAVRLQQFLFFTCHRFTSVSASSSQAVHPSLPHRCESSLAPLLLLSPQRHRLCGDPNKCHSPAHRPAPQPPCSGWIPAGAWPTGWKRCPTSRIPHGAGQLPPAWCIPPGRSVP